MVGGWYGLEVCFREFVGTLVQAHSMGCWSGCWEGSVVCPGVSGVGLMVVGY